MSAPWRVELVSVGAVAPALLRRAVKQLGAYLARPVQLAPGVRDPAPAFDAARKQYSAAVLLEGLLTPPPPAGTRRLAVTTGDLFVPVLTHVFGAAQLEGAVGVVSVHRLRPDFVGDPPDPGRLHARLMVELLHELGHTFGLVHCPRSWCAMAASRLPEQLDLKDAAYCTVCARTLGVPENHWRTGAAGAATEEMTDEPAEAPGRRL